MYIPYHFLECLCDITSIPEVYGSRYYVTEERIRCLSYYAIPKFAFAFFEMLCGLEH